MAPQTRTRSRASATQKNDSTDSLEERALAAVEAPSRELRNPTPQEIELIRSFIPEQEKILNELNAQVPTRTLTVYSNSKHPPRTVRVQLAAARSLMRRCRARLEPCQTLPDELIAEILLHAAAESEDIVVYKNQKHIAIRLRLTQICRHWRHVALTTRRLWNVFAITVREWAPDAAGRVAAWLERSGKTPLSLTLEYSFLAEPHAQSLVALLRPHALRIAEFRTTFRYTYFSPHSPSMPRIALSAFKEILAHAPHLRILHINDKGMEPCEVFKGVVHSGAVVAQLFLSKLSLVDWADPYLKRTASLTTLKIWHHAELPALLSVLGHASSLETLDIGGDWRYRGGTVVGLVPAGAEVIVCRALTTLRLKRPEGRTMLSLINAVSLPALTTLELDGPIFEADDIEEDEDSDSDVHLPPSAPLKTDQPNLVPSVVAFLTRSQCTLLCLKLIDAAEHRLPRSFTEHVVIAILQHAACRTLENLCVRRCGSSFKVDHDAAALFMYLTYDAQRGVFPNQCLKRLELWNITLGGLELTRPHVLGDMLLSRVSVPYPGAAQKLEYLRATLAYHCRPFPTKEETRLQNMLELHPEVKLDFATH
ncbi:hypothetical protein MKEN_01370000 [Mycena kentingensis (nom. inval.)]|nr:hypothetical protein MKEN_01370000 [Mycena kentingensis (nom. inval.)]